MGILSKIAKGFRTGLKSIGKKIKSTVKGFGKFMGKIGIVGQIGLSLLMPGIGTMFSQLAGGMAAYTGVGSTIINAAGKVMQTAIKFGSEAGKVFSNITDGVTGVLKEVGGATLNKLELGGLAKSIGFDTAGMTFDSVGTKVGQLFDGSVFNTTTEAVSAKTLDTLAKGPEVPTELTTEGVASNIESQLSVGTPSMPGTNLPELSVATPEKSFFNAPDMDALEIPKPTPSLLDRGIEAIKTLPEKAGEAVVGKLEDLPNTIAESAEGAVKQRAKQELYSAAGVETPTPVYNSYSTYVPSIDAAPTVQSAPSLDFTKYYQENYSDMSAAPYGANAYIYNTYKAEAAKRGI